MKARTTNPIELVRRVCGRSFLVALLSSGCTPQEPAEAPVEPATEAESEAESISAEESEPVSEKESEDGGWADEEAAASGPAPTELVGGICREICGKVKKSCSARAADFCIASCGDYENGAEQCPTEVHAALSCQTLADDFLLCSNIAAESCAPLYKAMNDCREGVTPPKPWGQKAEEAKEENIPVGFSRLHVRSGGFSIVAPEGVKVQPGEGGLFKAAASQGDFEYVVEAVSRDNKKKLDAKTLLRATTEYVGNACQPKLRLHGRYETQGVIHTRFDTVCSDGTEIRGMMHFWGENIVAASARHSAAGVQNPNLEPFIFSFELLSAE